ncbi:MAG: nitrate reductase cytochrome c-type subunit, partial [Colwellia sp.]
CKSASWSIPQRPGVVFCLAVGLLPAQSTQRKRMMNEIETRDGTTLSEVSPRRYFCSQCHVTQADAPELVDNTFKPVESLGNE